MLFILVGVINSFITYFFIFEIAAFKVDIYTSLLLEIKFYQCFIRQFDHMLT